MPYDYARPSSFPNGFPGGITIRGVPIQQFHPGKVFYLNNTAILAPGGTNGADGNPGTYQKPCLTLAGALLKCTADRGDMIMVMPGHAETISSATALALNVAGVAVVGLGTGTKRPTFTLDTANTTTIHVDAANVTVKNCKFVANFLGIVSCFTVAATTASPWFTLEECTFEDTSAILNFKATLTTTVSVNADNLGMYQNVIRSDATTRTTAPIVILGTMTGLRLVGNRVVNSVAQNNVAQLVSHAALVMSDLYVANNKVWCVNTDTASVAVLLSTTATTGSGTIENNVVRALDSAAAIMVTATAVQYGLFNNLYIGDGTSNSGFVLPAIGSDA